MSDAKGVKLFGVVGNPVKHSISPRLHQFWYDELALNARYVALEMADTSPIEDFRALSRSGFSGLNVTLPYKHDALACAAKASDAARRIGAANTLTKSDDESDPHAWMAHNTDITGFLWSFDLMVPGDGDEVVLVGAGGAARAVAAGLSDRGYNLIILNRTPERAEEMISSLNLTKARVFPLETLSDFAAVAPIVVNTISLGHSGGSLDIPENEDGLFVDISYGKAAEATLANAEKAGWRTLDGLPMLVGQAADAFDLWFKQKPDRISALRACREWTGTKETLVSL